MCCLIKKNAEVSLMKKEAKESYTNTVNKCLWQYSLPSLSPLLSALSSEDDLHHL